MSHRGCVASSCNYLEISAIGGNLVSNETIRAVACAARNELRLPFAALSLGSSEFSCTTSLFIRDVMVMPQTFAPCAVTAAGKDVCVIPQLPLEHEDSGSAAVLRSYAGCPVFDRESHCVGVFYVMNTKPCRFSPAGVAQLRVYTQLIANHIEILRRFGIDGPDPSPREIVCRADRVARQGRHNEARRLITLAYTAHDIACLRRRQQTSTLS
ncbi:hypothetical protein [Rhodopila sp.]|uniref:hypothetical protein n=1 Tax=Rhodopila sp. TaxID=2480087 RepID=UPI003D0BC821